MLRRKKFHVIYPEYFDQELTRSEGRRVPLSDAAENPTLKKLVYACKKLNIDYQEEEEKAFPSRWWEKRGRLLLPIDRKNKRLKSELVKEIGGIVRRLVPKKKLKKKKKASQEKSSYSGKTPPVR